MKEGMRDRVRGGEGRRGAGRGLANITLATLVLLGAGSLSVRADGPPPKTSDRVRGKENKEFREKVDSLVDAYRAKDLKRIAPFYAPDALTLTFHIPFKYDTGSTPGMSTAQSVLDEVSQLKIDLLEPMEVWKYKRKVWSLRPFHLQCVAKDGTIVDWKGRHSAIWEKRGDTWLIVDEHFLDEPEILRPTPAPAVAAAPPPTPAPAPVEPPPAVAPAAITAGRLSDVFFDLDKWNIRPDQRQTLNDAGAYLRENPEVRVLIEGHCDERQTLPYNDKLGQRRAESTKAYLVALGISADRMDTISFGKRRPFEQGQGEFVWQQNRRAHFVVKEKK